jgi:RHS repeat-associated protein
MDAVRTASSYGNQVGFTGRYLDKETGLWYFRARYYSGSLGRFVGRDPLGYVDGYSYYSAYFIPNFLDPRGLEWIDRGNNVWEAGADGDSLQDLSQKVIGYTLDWSCIWPIQEWKNPQNYPNATKCDKADVSNLVASNGPSLTLVMPFGDPWGQRMLQDRPAGVPAGNGQQVYEAIRKASGEGQTPINYIEIGGHGATELDYITANPPTDRMMGQPAGSGYFRPSDYNPGLPEPSYDRAKTKKGPQRCWHTHSATGFLLACQGQRAAKSFANQFLRVGAKFYSSDGGNFTWNRAGSFWGDRNDWGFGASLGESSVNWYRNIDQFLSLENGGWKLSPGKL